MTTKTVVSDFKLLEDAPALPSKYHTITTRVIALPVARMVRVQATNADQAQALRSGIRNELGRVFPASVRAEKGCHIVSRVTSDNIVCVEKRRGVRKVNRIGEPQTSKTTEA